MFNFTVQVMYMTEWKTHSKTCQNMTDDTGRTENIGLVESKGGSEMGRPVNHEICDQIGH
jgi:hypothetical protein